jgi:asparagine synthase (glutamine-hydrolysing)
MCGIAGIVDLTGRNPIAPGRLRRMTDALVHRGPDDEGLFHHDRIGLASRRLSIVGIADGHQPVANEDGTVMAVFNGELFDFRDVRRRLESEGHRLATWCDTEIIPHLWEDRQERMFEALRGQFAIAIWDARRRRVVLARDRFGILPVYWSHQKSHDGEWLLFASEIAALLASGYVSPAPDLKGIDQVFHFLAAPGPATCFAGVRLLQPGHYLSIDLDGSGQDPRIRDVRYWDLDFPDRGNEEDEDDHDEVRLVDRFEEVMLAAVERRLRADVPVVSYLSGGVDSSLVVAMAAKLLRSPPESFTVQIASPRFDETPYANVVARHLGAPSSTVRVDDACLVNTYPALIAAAEAPVIDTAAAASLLLAAEVHRRGFKVALAGEGSDEWLAGYPWHKVHKLIGFADLVPGLPLSQPLRRLLARLAGAPPASIGRITGAGLGLGHHSAFHDLYALMTGARYLLFNDETLDALHGHNPYLDLQPDLARIERWHPLSQSAFWAARIHLPGHLLSLKGDRVAMRSSVETRYPFLDEDVFAYLARLHPRWKLRGLRDKYLLRRLAERYLPAEIAWRRKAMFLAPSDSFFARGTPAYVDELLSDDSLRRSGWFSIPAVRYWRERIRRGTLGFRQRTFIELGMVGVVATQLWYHTFIDGALGDLPAMARSDNGQSARASAGRAASTGARATDRVSSSGDTESHPGAVPSTADAPAPSRDTASTASGDGARDT